MTPQAAAQARANEAGIVLYSRRAHQKQRQFHALCNTHNEVHFVAGRQSGKTEGGAGEMAKRTHLEPKFMRQDYLIAAPTYDKTLAARFRFQEMLPFGAWQFHAHEKRYIVQGAHGAVTNVWIRNANEDAPRSLTLDGAWIDEAAFCSADFYDNLRPALATRQGTMFTTTTPAGRNHHWLMYQGDDPKVATVFAESRDNPAFSEVEWQRAIDRYGYDSPFFQQEHRGLAAAFVGQAIPQIADGIIAPAKWNPDWVTVVGMDFGWTAGSCALLVQLSPDEDVIIHGLKYWTETDRTIVIVELDWPHVGLDAHQPIYAIDPSGSSGRAPEAGDVGWQQALEDMARNPRTKRSLVDVRWNRMIGESASLNMIREAATRKKLIISEDAVSQVHGGRFEGPHEIQRLMQGAMLTKNPEHDELENQHPESEVIDSLRYVYVCLLPHWQRVAGKPTIHKG